MTQFSFVRSAALVAVFGLAAATQPALAKKAPSVTLPAAAVKDPAGKLCMPRSVLGGSDSTTVCQTRAEWEAQGLTIIVK